MQLIDRRYTWRVLTFRNINKFLVDTISLYSNNIFKQLFYLKIDQIVPTSIKQDYLYQASWSAVSDGSAYAWF